jgi:hypothetical protein
VRPKVRAITFYNARGEEMFFEMGVKVETSANFDWDPPALP